MLRPSRRTHLLQSLSPAELQCILDSDPFWLNPTQREPQGDWSTWLFLGGRGAGKTHAGAVWVNEGVRAGRFGRIALIAPTFNDAREVMVQGPSGLTRLKAAPPVFEPTRRRLVWANGAQAFCFSAEDPYSLRGPQFDAAWGDEFAYWADPEETMKTLSLGLRLGARPVTLFTTTPRPIAALRDLLKRVDVTVTRARTQDNARHLAPGFIDAARAQYGAGAYARQELDAELIDDPPGALWTRAQIEAARVTAWPPFERVIVAVDPPAGVSPKADLCGIIVAARTGGTAPRVIVLADASVQGLSPRGWAERAAAQAAAFDADAIVAEANNGGEMVRAVLKDAAPDMPVRLAHARLDKRRRALPVAALYEAGRVAHAHAFKDLEDQMCAFGAPGFIGSPDRVDALVWAVTDLLLDRAAEPRARAL